MWLYVAKTAASLLFDPLINILCVSDMIVTFCPESYIFELRQLMSQSTFTVAMALSEERDTGIDYKNVFKKATRSEHAKLAF